MQMDGSLAGPRFRTLSETGNSKFLFYKIERTNKKLWKPENNLGNLKKPRKPIKKPGKPKENHMIM